MVQFKEGKSVQGRTVVHAARSLRYPGSVSHCNQHVKDERWSTWWEHVTCAECIKKRPYWDR